MIPDFEGSYLLQFHANGIAVSPPANLIRRRSTQSKENWNLQKKARQGVFQLGKFSLANTQPGFCGFVRSR